VRLRRRANFMVIVAPRGTDPAAVRLSSKDPWMIANWRRRGVAAGSTVAGSRPAASCPQPRNRSRIARPGGGSPKALAVLFLLEAGYWVVITWSFQIISSRCDFSLRSLTRLHCLLDIPRGLGRLGLFPRVAGIG